MLIRRELTGDSAAIREVHLAAFDRPALGGAEAPQARLVDALREDADVVPALSLVAEHDGEVVGPTIVLLTAWSPAECGPFHCAPAFQRI
jgi:putative acetyltransferase